MVSTESGTEFVYVSNEDINGDDTSKEYITVKSSSGEYELVLSKEVYPSITGVSIVCPGGDDYAIQVKLINSVSTAFGLSKNRICVVGTK
jgi:stage III sporulation protein AG